MKKLKVLHLIEGLGAGGAERLLYTNFKHFKNDLLENEVVTVFSGSDHWKKPIEKLEIPVETLDCKSVRDVLSGVKKLRQYLKTSKPDLIHTHLWTANIIGRIAGRLAGIPVISSIHNPDYETEAVTDGSDVSSIKISAARNIDKWSAFFGCRKMIAVSEYVRQSTFKQIGFPLEKIEVLYNPIDISAFEKKESAGKKEFFKKIGLPENALIILNVGRVTPQKGFIYAVRAMPEVKKKFPHAQLVSLGGQDNKSWLEKIETETADLNLQDSVHLLGAGHDVGEFLQHADIFIFPSLHEGLGIALIEAMAMSLACAATDTGPISEFVSDNENGLLVPPKEPKILAEKICELLADDEKRKRLGENARETALARFLPEPAAERLTEIYFAAAGKNQRGQ